VFESFFLFRLNTFKEGKSRISFSRLFHAKCAAGINDLENISVRLAIVTLLSLFLRLYWFFSDKLAIF
jgi:hypothetical protein